MKKSTVLGVRDAHVIILRGTAVSRKTTFVAQISLLSVFAMNFARYSTIAAVSSPTGLMKWGGNANPY